MARDPHAADAHAVVLAGLSDVYLHVDSLHQRCLTFLNSGSDEDFPALLSEAYDVLQSIWWLGGDSLMFLRNAGAIRSGESLYPSVQPDIPEIHDGYDDELRKAIAALEGAIGEVEQQVYGIVHSGDIDAVDIRQTKDALLVICYLTSIALERIERIDAGLRSVK